MLTCIVKDFAWAGGCLNPDPDTKLKPFPRQVNGARAQFTPFNARQGGEADALEAMPVRRLNQVLRELSHAPDERVRLLVEKHIPFDRALAIMEVARFVAPFRDATGRPAGPCAGVNVNREGDPRSGSCRRAATRWTASRSTRCQGTREHAWRMRLLRWEAEGLHPDPPPDPAAWTASAFGRGKSAEQPVTSVRCQMSCGTLGSFVEMNLIDFGMEHSPVRSHIEGKGATFALSCDWQRKPHAPSLQASPNGLFQRRQQDPDHEAAGQGRDSRICKSQASNSVTGRQPKRCAPGDESRDAPVEPEDDLEEARSLKVDTVCCTANSTADPEPAERIVDARCQVQRWHHVNQLVGIVPAATLAMVGVCGSVMSVTRSGLLQSAAFAFVVLALSHVLRSNVTDDWPDISWIGQLLNRGAPPRPMTSDLRRVNPGARQVRAGPGDLGLPFAPEARRTCCLARSAAAR